MIWLRLTFFMMIFWKLALPAQIWQEKKGDVSLKVFWQELKTNNYRLIIEVETEGVNIDQEAFLEQVGLRISAFNRQFYPLDTQVISTSPFKYNFMFNLYLTKNLDDPLSLLNLVVLEKNSSNNLGEFFLPLIIVPLKYVEEALETEPQNIFRLQPLIIGQEIELENY